MSYEVVVYALEVRKRGSVSYRVRWRVGTQPFARTFTRKALAESFRTELITATRKDERFSEETGLPTSMDQARSDVSFYEVAVEFTRSAWPSISAKSRVSVLETLSRVVPVVVRDLPGAPDRGVLRLALTHSLVQGPHAPELDADELAALSWLRRASRPVSALTDAPVLADVLDALAVNLDGKPAAPAYFSRRRRVLHRAMSYAVRKKHLEVNPLDSLPDGWTAPATPADAIDPRAIGSPELVEHMLDVCATIGTTQGPRFRAFYGCMYHGLMRPSEVAALTVGACELPAEGWGWLTISDASDYRGPRLHRRRSGARAPGAEGPDPGQAEREGPQADPACAHPTGAGDHAARAHRQVRHRARWRISGVSRATRYRRRPGRRSGRRYGPQLWTTNSMGRR